MPTEPFEDYDPVDRRRVAQILTALPMLASQIREANELVALEYQAGVGGADMEGGVSMLRGQADAIERVAVLQAQHATLIRELAGLIERNNA